MKHFYLTILLLMTGLLSFSQYYVYTAKKSGVWNDISNWTITPRTDGVPKMKVIIPASYMITADNNVNAMGLGNADLVVGGTLSLAAGTNIALGSGSTIELTGGSIKGSASSQKIRFGSIVKYQGDLDNNKAGYYIADNLTSSSPIGFRSTASILAVKFTGFNVKREAEKKVSISWATADETNNNRFEIERSEDGKIWKKIAIVFPSVGNQQGGSYKYSDDASKAKIWYYRIRQIDNNGVIAYSAIKMIGNANTDGNVKIFGYAGHGITAKFRTPTETTVAMRVLGMDGQLIGKKQISAGTAIANYSPVGIVRGHYVVQVSDGKGWTAVQKVSL